MTKKTNKKNDNVLDCVERLICTAKRRRRMALLALQQLNNEAGGRGNIYLVK